MIERLALVFCRTVKHHTNLSGLVRMINPVMRYVPFHIGFLEVCRHLTCVTLFNNCSHETLVVFGKVLITLKLHQPVSALFRLRSIVRHWRITILQRQRYFVMTVPQDHSTLQFPGTFQVYHQRWVR